MELDFPGLIQVAQHAGARIMGIYAQDFEVSHKADASPLTRADMASNKLIVDYLQKTYPDIPIISEENKQIDYAIRKQWEYCWLVDPLDGTKEFIKRNGEFTVNIALIKEGKPVAGVIFVPVKKTTYFADGNGAYRINQQSAPQQIHTRPPTPGEPLVIMGSRSHSTPEVNTHIAAMQRKYGEVRFEAAGSSLKFCRIAEGLAHQYPRLGPTMEWDTGAGQAIVEQAGGRVLTYDERTPLTYNKASLLNPYFLVEA